jgi:hypothetical protein
LLFHSGDDSSESDSSSDANESSMGSNAWWYLGSKSLITLSYYEFWVVLFTFDILSVNVWIIVVYMLFMVMCYGNLSTSDKISYTYFIIVIN